MLHDVVNHEALVVVVLVEHARSEGGDVVQDDHVHAEGHRHVVDPCKDVLHGVVAEVVVDVQPGGGQLLVRLVVVLLREVGDAGVDCWLAHLEPQVVMISAHARRAQGC